MVKSGPCSVSAFPWETATPPADGHRESVEGASGWPPNAGVFAQKEHFNARCLGPDINVHIGQAEDPL